MQSLTKWFTRGVEFIAAALLALLKSRRRVMAEKKTVTVEQIGSPLRRPKDQKRSARHLKLPSVA